jgi:hypothetical protein
MIQQIEKYREHDNANELQFMELGDFEFDYQR